MSNQPADETALGAFLARRRQELGLSLGNVAERMGNADKGWVFRIERGAIRNTTPERLQALARALESDIEDLYAIAGITVPEQLPGFSAYLRAKYDLPDQAVDQLDEYFQLLKSKYGDDGDGQ